MAMQKSMREKKSKSKNEERKGVAKQNVLQKNPCLLTLLLFIHILV